MEIAIEVNRAVELDITIPALGYNIDKVLELIVEADPIKISVIIYNIFFNQFFIFFPEIFNFKI